MVSLLAFDFCTGVKIKTAIDFFETLVALPREAHEVHGPEVVVQRHMLYCIRLVFAIIPLMLTINPTSPCATREADTFRFFLPDSFLYFGSRPSRER